MMSAATTATPVVVYDFTQMSAAAESIKQHSQTIAQAAVTLFAALDTNLADFQGDGANAFKAYLNDKVKPYLTTDLPTLLDQLAEQLQGNSNSMAELDAKIKASYSGQ